MPRHRTAPAAIRPIAHISMNPSVQLQSYPTSPTPVEVPAAVLVNQLFTKPDAKRVTRQRFGRGLDMDRIQIALNSAHRGAMRSLTDISRETIDVDPHLSSVLNKRFGALASLPFEVQPAAGRGIDEDLAVFYADVVRDQIKKLRSFRQNLRQLAWGLFDGRACLEIKWRQLAPQFAVSEAKFGAATWVVESLAWIHPRRLTFGPRRELQITNEEDGESFGGNFTLQGLQVDALPNKFVRWTPQLFGEYPEREGLAPKVLYWSFFKRWGARERLMLAELMGKPWRIIEVDQESTAGDPEMQAADEIVDALGASYTARLPRGTKLNVVQPGNNSGVIHKDIIDSTDKQISKLVLGQTGTTDGTPAGLNNNQASVMQDEQLMILVNDAHGLSEVIEEWLTDRMIALNFGEDAVTHAPTFTLRSDLPADRKAELERLQLALDAGLSVKIEEAYEVSGFTQPNSEMDTILRTEQPPTPAGAPNAPNPRPVLVFPTGDSPAQGEQQPPPTTASSETGSRDDATADITLPATALETVITVNEARRSQNLGPLMLPEFDDEGEKTDGGEDPDGELTIAEFKAKRAVAGSTDPTSGPTPPDGGDDAGNSGDDGPDEPGSGGPTGGNLPSDTAREVEDVEDDGTEEGELEDEEDETPAVAAHAATMERMNSVLGEMESFMEGRRSDNSVMLFVKKIGNEWVIFTKDGKTRLGKFRTKTAADKRLKQIEFFKNQGVNASTDVLEALDEVEMIAKSLALECCGVQVDLAAADGFTQQEGFTGDPEDLVIRGEKLVSEQMLEFATRYKKKVKFADTPTAIFSALNEVWEELDTSPLAAILDEYFEQSLMMGALDNRGDQEGDLVRDESQRQVDEQGGAMPTKQALASFTDGNAFQLALSPNGSGAMSVKLATGDPVPDFAKLPFQEAGKFFRSLNVMTKASFDNASAEVQRRAFTVAGNLSTQMLAVLQHELVRQIEAGTSLAEFDKAITARLNDAGFLPTTNAKGILQASHTETVFRTNTLNAYNTGRVRQASQPNVARVFPTWEIRTARDKRVRDSHKALNGKRLLASDPFWRNNYPPFDYNCRCRVVSRRSITNVVAGDELTSPTPQGFTSGTANLI
jgi:SPP1 gp7 family putative phage head morphogenesis protein